MSEYRYAGIETYDINNGKLFGVTLFVQGCPHHCVGCHNPTTWDFSGGMPWSMEAHDKLFNALADDNISRLTISGGEPFSNIDFVADIVTEFKNLFPKKYVWIYTGFTFEQLMSGSLLHSTYPILEKTDVLVDGRFIAEQCDLSLPFRGSRNQRIIDVPRSINGHIVELSPTNK